MLRLETNIAHKHRLPNLSLAILVLMASTALTISGCEKKKAEAKESSATLVKVQSVLLAPISSTIKGSGTVAAWQDVVVGAEVGGMTIVALNVEEGQYVKQGQPLLRMNDVLLQSQVKQAKARADQAQKSYNRAKELLDKGFLSQAALDLAFANQQTSQAELQIAQTNLSLSTIRAPVAGIISSRKAVLGQIVAPGAELFRIVRDGRIELNLDVVESDLHRIQTGQAATVYLSDGQTVEGSVRIVTPIVDSATRLGIARITVPWSSGLRPGMFARAQIGAVAQNALIVAQRAVIYRENKPGVFVVGSDGKAHYTPIELGQAVGLNIAVKSGLSEQQSIITTGAGFLNDGDPVKVTAIVNEAR